MRACLPFSSSGLQVTFATLDTFTTPTSVVIVGSTNGTISTATNNGGADGFLVKLSSVGAVTYVQEFGSASDESFAHLTIDSAGDYHISGTSTGDYAATNAGGLDAILVKVTGTTGAFVWKSQFGTTGDDALVWSTMNSTAVSNVVAVGYASGMVDSQSYLANGDMIIVDLDGSTGTRV